MDVVGVVALFGLVLVYFAIESSEKKVRSEVSRRIDRLESKVDLLLKQAGLEEPALPREEEILALARSGKKIQAIKVYREVTGAGLAEAKNEVERLT
ncbi:LSU ribosomal L12P-like protein [Nocardioides albertanoniae]|uniref:LSU ribosomal L12P-like protein n=1 Tax=Nocardioides albertanoniae TaxID=1175486 RepID=A0A543A3P2_9ACTN|nr:ribosomal protein L7/L12 [Nocardioides albertanoniae]TQL67184.1 LSU ribosomal L12P-like protein [Nocardioides albertanoniae]